MLRVLRVLYVGNWCSHIATTTTTTRGRYTVVVDSKTNAVFYTTAHVLAWCLARCRDWTAKRVVVVAERLFNYVCTSYTYCCTVYPPTIDFASSDLATYFARRPGLSTHTQDDWTAEIWKGAILCMTR